MSAFSKLKLYSRRPVAVIMAALMATSTVPVSQLAQATAAYAAGPEQGKAETESHAVNGNWNDINANANIVFDTHPADKSTDSGSLKITQAQVMAAIKSNDDIKNLFTYNVDDQGKGTNKFSETIINALNQEKEKYEDDTGEVKVDPDTNIKTQVNVKFDKDSFALKKDEQGNPIALSYNITDVDYEIEVEGTDSNEVTVSKSKDTGDVTLSAQNALSDLTVKIAVKSISYKYSFDYTYTKTTTTTTWTPKGTTTDPTNPDTGDSGETGGSSEGIDKGDGTNTGTGTGSDPEYNEPTTKDYTETPTVSVKEKDQADKLELASAQTPTSTYVNFGGKLSASDYWAGTTLPEKNLAISDLAYKHEGSDSKSATFSTTSGLKAELTNANDFFFGAVPTEEKGDAEGKSAYTITVTPKHATTEEKELTVKYTYPDGQPVGTGEGTVTVKVGAIAKETIDLGAVKVEESLPFRMANNSRQADEIKRVANEAVSNATGDILKDYYTSAKVVDEDYYNDVFSARTLVDASDVKFAAKEPGSTDAGDYDVVNDFNFKNAAGIETQPKIQIDAVKKDAWAADGAAELTVSGTGLKNENFKSPADAAKAWLHTDTKVSSNGGKLYEGDSKLSNSSEFKDTLTFGHAANGTQTNAYFVQNNGTGIVTWVHSVTYLFDGTTPGLTAFNAVPKGENKKTSDKKVWAAENMDVEFFASEGETNGTESGMNKVTGTYIEQKSGKKETVRDISTANRDKNDSYKYTFSINADSKVSSDSIKVTLQDKAGNTSRPLGYQNALTNNIHVAELVADTTGPTIEAAWSEATPHNGNYYNQSRTLTLTVHAPFFNTYTKQYLGNAPMATITKDGKAYKTLVADDTNWKSLGNDTWSYTITFDADGDYEVSGINVQDILGRSDTAAGDKFTIDKTAPTMQVTFDNNDVRNGKYYNAARTATITVTEHNFDPAHVKIEPTAAAGNGGEVGQPVISGWSNNGDVHTATVSFPGQGVYTLSVNGEDLATNKLEGYTAPEFVVDTQKPEIKIDNVANKTAYAGDVAPSVSIHDTNLDSSSSIDVAKVSYPLSPDDGNPYANKPASSATDMTVTYTNPKRVKENDGVYTVTVQASDLAGNTDSQAVTWSVNRFGSTYVISDDTGKMIDQFLKSAKTVDVKVTEINPSGLDESKTAVELTRDTKNATLKSGDDYETAADSSKGWHEYVYTVDKGNYDADGTYRVLFHSEDAAGNASENTMEGKNAKDEKAAAEVAFAVDDTKPIASFVDLENGGKYEESEHKAKVNFEDNLKLDRAEIAVNGETVAKFDAKELEANPVKSFTLPGSPDKQDVTVKVWDAAGNESDELKASGVLVTNDALVLWMNNTPLLVGSIAAVVVVAGGIYALVAKKRKQNGDGAAEA